ncbi:MAG TPA: MarR family transcriptional regulator [Polyangia bacterium]
MKALALTTKVAPERRRWRGKLVAASSALTKPALPALGGALDFMRLIWSLDHSLQRTSKHMAASVGITGPQRLVIRIVGKISGLPAGQLARLLHVHPSTLTGILGRLERRQLLRRRVDPRDGRRILLTLTGKGRRFNVHTEGTVEAAIRRVLERTPAVKLQAVREVLSALAAALSNIATTSEDRRR